MWFSKGNPAPSTNKTDHYDIAEILLKVTLNTITLTLKLSKTLVVNKIIIFSCEDRKNIIHIKSLNQTNWFNFFFSLNRDESTQLTALKIVKAVMMKLKPAEMNKIYPTITTFSSHPSASCRNVMYDIMMWVCDNYR